MTEPHAHAPPTACENCGSALQGHYCHVCGQRVHNPLNHFGHALEDVFESLWHLDGRIFRTLRDLFVPGRVAAGYLAGHRVRYVAPLRLFIILSLLTFFVGKLALHVPPESVDASPDADPGLRIQTGSEEEAELLFAGAVDIDAVMAVHRRALDKLHETNSNPVERFILPMFEDLAREQLDAGARRRMQTLGIAPERIDAVFAERDAKAARESAVAGRASEKGAIARWMAQRGERVKRNLESIRQTPDELVRLVLGAVPGALFVLVPLFALCLKLLYIRSGRGYLEHLVVALYSHAFMLVALLVSFLLVWLQSVPGLPAWGVAVSATAATFTLFLFVPLYLLCMQKRVYAQGWVKTLMKYATLGLVYSVLLVLGLLYAVLAGLSS